MSQAWNIPVQFRPEQPVDPFAGGSYAGYPACLMAAATRLEEGQLTPAESGRLGRVLSASRQAEMRGSFLLRRSLVADLTGAKAGDVTFSADTEGAPILVSPAGQTVTLANKSSLTIVALAPAPLEIGVDLELIRPLDWRPILSMICDGPERAAFEQDFGHRPDAVAAFFRMWTLKEAVLKTTRKGFRAGPKAVDTTGALSVASGAGDLAAFGHVFDFWMVTRGDAVVTLAQRRA